MDFQLSSEQKLLQESARRMVARQIELILSAHDPDRSLPQELSLQVIQHYASQKRPADQACACWTWGWCMNKSPQPAS